MASPKKWVTYTLQPREITLNFKADNKIVWDDFLDILPNRREYKQEQFTLKSGPHAIVHYKGRNTFVTLRFRGVTGRGEARLNPADRYDPQIGKSLALARAYADFSINYAEKIIKRVQPA